MFVLNFKSMTLAEKINEDIKAAMLAKDAKKLEALRAIKSGLLILKTGKGAKICELNGCWSEPIHIYDDNHTLAYAIREFIRSYNSAYKIAKLNKKRFKKKAPVKEFLRSYRLYLKEKNEIIRIVG